MAERLTTIHLFVGWSSYLSLRQACSSSESSPSRCFDERQASTVVSTLEVHTLSQKSPSLAGGEAEQDDIVQSDPILAAPVRAHDRSSSRSASASSSSNSSFSGAAAGGQEAAPGGTVEAGGRAREGGV
jgi:hypothetical protein